MLSVAIMQDMTSMTTSRTLTDILVFFCPIEVARNYPMNPNLDLDFRCICYATSIIPNLLDVGAKLSVCGSYAVADPAGRLQTE